MSYALYLLGFAILLAGAAWGFVTAGVPGLYVSVGLVLVFALGLVTGQGWRSGGAPNERPNREAGGAGPQSIKSAN